MPKRRPHDVPEWRQFEQLVARIEKVMAGANVTVTSPDRVQNLVTKTKREVDASIRTTVGSVDILVTVECRKRGSKQDVTWIEQLGAKKQAIGAARTIAVASRGFSQEAIKTAHHCGIDLRVLSEITDPEIQGWMLPHSVVHVFKEGSLYDSPNIYFIPEDGDKNNEGMPPKTELNADSKVFEGPEGLALSLNDIWLRADANMGIFEKIPKDDLTHRVAVTRNIDFPLRLLSRDGYRFVHSIKLPMLMRWRHEVIELAAAKVVAYEHSGGDHGVPVQVRAEFESKQAKNANIRLGMQFAAGSDLASFDVQFIPPVQSDT